MAKKIILLSLMLAITGDALPNSSRNVSNSTAVSSPHICGQVIINNNIAEGRDGEVGPQGPRGERGPAGPPGGGVSYTRWGRTTCPTTEGTQLLYKGEVVGSQYNEGGSSQYLCLHNQPQFLQITPGLQARRARLNGIEYGTTISPPALSDLFLQDPPCSLCYTPSRSAIVTIPGRIECPTSWTREYHGYLMTIQHDANHQARAPICIDVDAEGIPGSAGSISPHWLVFIETTCTGIKCPPYSNGAEITCVVCTK